MASIHIHGWKATFISLNHYSTVNSSRGLMGIIVGARRNDNIEVEMYTVPELHVDSERTGLTVEHLVVHYEDDYHGDNQFYYDEDLWRLVDVSKPMTGTKEPFDIKNLKSCLEYLKRPTLA